MAISGHQQLATLQQYVKPSQDAVAKLMAETDPTGAAVNSSRGESSHGHRGNAVGPRAQAGLGT